LIKLFLALSILIFFISCNDQKTEKLSNPLVLKDGLLYSDSLSTIPFTGRNISRMLDMKIEYEVVDGIKEGAFITYFPNGKVQISGTMKNNKNVGEWKYYFPSGLLETTGYFENDIPTGKWTWFNQSGKIIEEGMLIKGLREGEWNSFDSSGSLSIIRTFKKDKLLDSTKVN
jgi:antitoxin component YwqK of YwqJK toxin-antitoxin module